MNVDKREAEDLTKMLFCNHVLQFPLRKCHAGVQRYHLGFGASLHLFLLPYSIIHFVIHLFVGIYIYYYLLIFLYDREGVIRRNVHR